MKSGSSKVKQIILGCYTIESKRPQGGGVSRKVYKYKCPYCECEFESSNKKKVFCSQRCARVHLARKPRVRKCAVCGDDFSVNLPKGRGKNYSCRVTCSKKCEVENRRRNINYKCPQRIAKLSKNAVENNYIKNVQTPEIHKKAGRLAGDAKVGRPGRGKMKQGTPQKNRSIFFYDPEGDIHEVKCIRGFVRENEYLFDASDIVRTQDEGRSSLDGNMKCKAMSGLQALVNPSSKLKTWKGWTLSHIINATDSGSSLRDSTNPVVEGGAE